MAELLLRTKAVIEDCEQFLQESGAFGSPVESYLVQHALVVLCADVQQEVYKIAQARADTATDKQIAHFVGTVSQRVLRSVRKDELAAFVGFFGESEKKKFNAMLDDAEVTRYNNAVSNRHDVAHKAGVQVTFRELKESMVAAANILASMGLSIALTAETEHES